MDVCKTPCVPWLAHVKINALLSLILTVLPGTVGTSDTSEVPVLDIMMNPEILTTLGVGIAIIAVVVPAILYLSGRIDETNKRIDETNRSVAEYAKETNKRIDETNRSLVEYAKETNKRFDEVNRHVDEQSREQAAFREDVAGRMGKLEGLLEGLRELIINKRAA